MERNKVDMCNAGDSLIHYNNARTSLLPGMEVSFSLSIATPFYIFDICGKSLSKTIVSFRCYCHRQ